MRMNNYTTSKCNIEILRKKFDFQRKKIVIFGIGQIIRTTWYTQWISYLSFLYAQKRLRGFA